MLTLTAEQINQIRSESDVAAHPVDAIDGQDYVLVARARLDELVKRLDDLESYRDLRLAIDQADRGETLSIAAGREKMSELIAEASAASGASAPPVESSHPVVPAGVET